MLSVLGAGEGALPQSVVTTAERPARDNQVKSPRQVKHIRQDRLRVASLNVSDLEIIQRARSVENSATRRAGTPRVRHFVNGHLFLAPNGKMTWRRPHWQGSEPPALSSSKSGESSRGEHSETSPKPPPHTFMIRQSFMLRSWRESRASQLSCSARYTVD